LATISPAPNAAAEGQWGAIALSNKGGSNEVLIKYTQVFPSFFLHNLIYL